MLMDLQERAVAIHRKLLHFYGYPQWREPLAPLDELVSTIISQNTNDVNRDRAYASLRARFPTWEAVRDAEEKDVIAAIRQAGLANIKGPRIQNILRQISAERKELDLEFLADMSDEEAKDWLLTFKGVGPKTAAIVLQFSLGKPAFPVDTHIYRVTGRLGLRPSRMNVEATHPHLASLFPPDTYYPVHLNLIRLGREVCQSRRPDCPNCPLNNLCHYFDSQSGSEERQTPLKHENDV